MKIDFSGGRAKCPVCGKSCAIPTNKRLVYQEGLWAHMRKHKLGPDDRKAISDQLFAECKRIKLIEVRQNRAERLEREQAAEAEALRLKSKFEFTGEELDEIIDQMNGLIDMMEPYYKQCEAYEEAETMIGKIEARMADAAQ